MRPVSQTINALIIQIVIICHFTWKMTICSGPNFAHAMTAELLWYVQICLTNFKTYRPEGLVKFFVWQVIENFRESCMFSLWPSTIFFSWAYSTHVDKSDQSFMQNIHAEGPMKKQQTADWIVRINTTEKMFLQDFNYELISCLQNGWLTASTIVWVSILGCTPVLMVHW